MTGCAAARHDRSRSGAICHRPGHAAGTPRSMVWMVYPLLLGETVMAAFFQPARNSVIPNIAARGEVLVANTLSSATWSVNLLIGASVGGVVAAFFGRDAVFLLNALSFLLSAILISGMRFAEPHAESATALRARDLIGFSPVLEGLRYVRNHRMLRPAVFAKAGELNIGPSWVIFTVLGAHEFAIHWHNVNPAGEAMLGMSILLGGRGLGALIGPVISARWRGAAIDACNSGYFSAISLSPWDTERLDSARPFGSPALALCSPTLEVRRSGFFRRL